METTEEKRATFTPGPWHYSEVIRGRDQYYRQIRADFKIAEVHACHSGVAGTKKGRAEDEANARLIAAAPDLLDALKNVKRALGMPVSLEAIRLLVDEAIHKAEVEVEGGEG